jgi:uncharacterized membrane protein
MNEKAAGRAGLRDRLPFAPKREELFRWRGNEVSRVEGFTDAVFAFAVTLLVVALEVPHTYEGLLDVVRGFPAFCICFALLMTFWNAHYRFHRRYGMEDALSRVGTMAILVLVLFFVYPLKFLFTMVTVGLFGLDMHDSPHLESMAQVDMLYVIYGLGFAGAWSLFGLLYLHAYRARERLKLDPSELLLTRASLMEYAVHVGVCLLSVALALLTDTTALPGLVYFLLAPSMTFIGWRYGTKARRLAAASS